MRKDNYTLAHSLETAIPWPALVSVDLAFRNLTPLLPARGSLYGTETYNLYVPTTEELLEWYSP